MAVRKSFGFKVPDTDQGRNIKRAVDALFMEDLPQTTAWPLFEGMARRPPLLAAHRLQVAGAIATIVTNGLTLEQEESLAGVHRGVEITGEQFGEVATKLLERLVWVGEPDVADALRELAPNFQEIWVKD